MLFNPTNAIRDTFSLKNLGFFVIASAVLMQMLDWGSAYRFFAYLNLLLVLVFGFAAFKKNPSHSQYANLYGIFVIPLAFIGLHFLAVENISIIKEIRHLFVAIFLALGVWILAQKNPDYLKRYAFAFLLALIFSYVAIQAIAFWYFKLPHGTTKNPHYLAIYSALMLIASVYCFFKATNTVKVALAASAVCLGIFLLHSSSRPTWIGLIISALLLLFFMNRRTRVLAALSFMGVLAGLILANIGNFASRFGDLLGHLSTEERVVIWRDAWRMQLDSTNSQWLLGHGLNSFKENFKPYSYYHLQNIDYNSPHNFFLELLYLSGFAGLILAVSLYWILYRNLLVSIKNQAAQKPIYLLLFAVLTTNLILVSITLPFFTSYNLNVIAIVFGVMLYLKQVQHKLTP